MKGQEKCDLLIEVTAWAGLAVLDYKKGSTKIMLILKFWWMFYWFFQLPVTTLYMLMDNTLMTGGGLEIRAWDSINAYRPANARIVSFNMISHVKFVAHTELHRWLRHHRCTQITSIQHEQARLFYWWWSLSPWRHWYLDLHILTETVAVTYTGY